MSLPETTEQDLWRVGLTPQIVGQRLKEAGFLPHDADIKSFYLPNPGDYDDWKIIRARNDARYDWTLNSQGSPVVIDEGTYTQELKNFDSDYPTQIQFSTNVTETEGKDYSQSKAFDISVNAQIPLGLSGAMIGFSASMSSTEIQSKSWSKTESRSISFPVDVPAREGRKVVETTTLTGVDSVYEAVIGPRWTAGVRTEQGWVAWFYNIDYHFPQAVSTARIRRTTVNTINSTTINKISSLDANESLPLIFQRHAFEAYSHKVDGNDLGGFAVKYKEPALKIQRLNLVTQQEPMRIDFRGANNPIPVDERARKVDAFRGAIFRNSSDLKLVGFVPIPIYTPSRNAPDYASLTISYDADQITRQDLRLKLVNIARLSVGIGGYFLIFI